MEHLAADSQRDAESGVVVTSQANIERFQDRSSHLIASLEVEMIRARRYGRPLGLINLVGADTRGPAAGGRSTHRQLNLEKRMRRLAPVILRQPDFWGRIDRYGFLIVLTDTDQTGVDAAIGRMVASEPFEALLCEAQGRSVFALHGAQLEPDVETLGAFVRRTQARRVWSSDGPGAVLPLV
ncbi:MAG: hypothetical protein AAFR16_13975 [Pseudomonadota bacterium]